MKKKRARHADGASPVRALDEELLALRSDLRATARAYMARLEIELAEARAAITVEGPVENLPSEFLHHLRHLTSLVRDRRIKPEKGRRKDLRQLDTLITDLHAMTHPDSRK